MIRLRRYRVFLFVSVFCLIAVYYYGQRDSWQTAAKHSERPDFTNAKPAQKYPPPLGEDFRPPGPGREHDVPKPAKFDPLTTSSSTSTTSRVRPPVLQETSSTSSSIEALTAETDAAETSISSTSSATDVYAGIYTGTEPIYASATIDYTETHSSASATWPVVHWSRMPEKYPIPSASIIPLPTGSPKPIPRIQYDFSQESTVAESQRQKKLQAIKAAFERTWAGYTEYAWMHDELRPVTKSYKDPFGGWSATLVDSLDTLWIMGMTDEFEKAVEATKNIDFTTTTQLSIPLFETTIRYLGGLLGAYDVSNAKYRVLLDKAVELAEILMYAFDTPNRMPQTFSKWQPSDLERTRVASRRTVLAELGSLSVEFTRLAQLTEESKYYDAIARITNEFYDWQDNTTLPGLFPIWVDASGCDDKYHPSYSSTQGKKTGPSVAHERVNTSSRSLAHPTASAAEAVETAAESDIALKDKSTFGTDRSKVVEPEESDEEESWRYKDSSTFGTDRPSKLKRQLDVEDTEDPYSECTHGLRDDSMSSKYAIGALADSTYEYLPKEFLLLGGLNDQYETLYEKFVEASKEYIFYRPMIEDEERTIMLSGSYVPLSPWNKTKAGRVIGNFDATTGHLNCFIGGLVGLGAKVFNRKEELTLAKQLTDACIWAYESTDSGIMPEDFEAMVCPDLKHCAWNETAWHHELDPQAEYRDKQAQKALLLAKEREDERVTLTDPEDPESTAPTMPGAPPTVPSIKLENLDKRQMNAVDVPDDLKHSPETEKSRTAAKEAGHSSSTPASKTVTDHELAKSSKANQEESGRLAGLSPTKTGSTAAGQKLSEDKYKPQIPLTHKEYVAMHIHEQHLAPGFVSIKSAGYLLRPEAIESVYYMYRLTGEDYWREKGWEMFQSVERETKTAVGNSAIKDVRVKDSRKDDSMESFWTAETLKYFYLLFSDPSLISLDDYVFNTEAHPLRRPDAGKGSNHLFH